jgi:hypothetical protein
MEIVRALDGIVNEQKAAHEKEHTYEDKKAGRERLTIIGIFTAAALSLAQSVLFYCSMRDAREFANTQDTTTKEAIGVAITANVIAKGAAAAQVAEMAKQSATMQGQLDQMKAQLLITKTTISAHIIPLPVLPVAHSVHVENGIVTGWNINPQFINAGGTDAHDYRAWWDMDVSPGPFPHEGVCPTHSYSDARPPMTIGPGLPLTLVAKILSLDEGTRAKDGKVVIYISGHMEYRDIFPDTPMHYYNWCSTIAVPNDIETNTFSFINVKIDTK